METTSSMRQNTLNDLHDVDAGFGLDARNTRNRTTTLIRESQTTGIGQYITMFITPRAYTLEQGVHDVAVACKE
jgi:hypothetical protein